MMDTEIMWNPSDDRAERPAWYVEVYDEDYKIVKWYGPYQTESRAAHVDQNIRRNASWFIT